MVFCENHCNCVYYTISANFVRNLEAGLPAVVLRQQDRVMIKETQRKNACILVAAVMRPTVFYENCCGCVYYTIMVRLEQSINFDEKGGTVSDSFPY